MYFFFSLGFHFFFLKIIIREYKCLKLKNNCFWYQVYRDEIQMVCANGAIIRCPGLFDGEMIVMVESSSRAIVVAMNATDPNTWHAVSVFNKLVQKNFAQCTQAEQKER